MSDIFAVFEAVKDEATFVALLEALEIDRREGKATWESDTIEDFLEAAARWADDTKGNPKFYQANPWRRAAEIVFCGKLYE